MRVPSRSSGPAARHARSARPGRARATRGASLVSGCAMRGPRTRSFRWPGQSGFVCPASSLLVSLACVVVLLTGCGGKDHANAAKHGTHNEGDVAAGNALDRVPKIPVGNGHLAAMAGKQGFTLRDKPNGSVIAHLKPTTDYGSPTVVSAARRRGHWLGVITPALPNNRLGWMDVNHDRPRMWRTRLE